MEPPATAANTDNALAPRRRRSLWQELLLGATRFIVVVSLGSCCGCSSTSPYGSSHACSKCLGGDIRVYAGDHDGWLPHGRTTPEASLSLILETDPNSAELLRGKHILQKVVDEALRRDGVLGPESCGWHYVEGLREDDNLEIAVVWDKVVGLGHFGERRKGVMHEVILLGGSMQIVSRQRWPDFVAEQKKLLQETMAKRSKGDPPIRWSDEATLGTNVNPPRLTTPVATDTNAPKRSP